MTPEELEVRLRRLGAEWPVPSVAEAVLARIGTFPAPPPRRPLFTRRRAGLCVAGAALAAAALGLLVLAPPATLQAQVEQALAKAGTAHIVISAPDERGVRRRAEIWYARGRGFRAEAPDEIVQDDGRQQWTWRPGAAGGELVVAQRASRGAAGMIAGMFHLGDAPAAWGRQRSPEHDRAVGGRPCLGLVITPPARPVAAENGRDPVPDLHPPRFVVLTDPDERIVSIEEQRPAGGGWQTGREVVIAYDVEVPAEKLAVQLPAGARVIDADRALEERFPLERALARAEAGGLLFAVHEVQRGEDDTVYAVSSVRGTPAYLKDHPPHVRRVNLHTTLLDVAEQVAGNVDQDCHRAALARAESGGVHYLWWLAARRRFFSVERGKRVPQFESPPLEVRPGTVRLPLQAFYRGPGAGSSLASVAVEVPVAGDPRVVPLAEIAARVRRDGLLIQQAPGAVVSLYGWVGDAQMRNVAPDQITDADFAEGVRRQLEWLRSNDKVSRPPQGMPPPPEPDA